MRNNIWFVVACVLVFCVGYNINDVAISFPRYKVAVIDIPEVMSKSTELQELKRAQDKDMEELNILISKAQNELINEQNRSKFAQKEAEYRKQIETKKKDKMAFFKVIDEYNSIDYYLQKSKLYDSGLWVCQENWGEDYFHDDENEESSESTDTSENSELQSEESSNYTLFRNAKLPN